MIDYIKGDLFEYVDKIDSDNQMESLNDRLIQQISVNKKKIEIHCPKFGCGLAGGKWERVEEMIKVIWSGWDVYVYEL